MRVTKKDKIALLVKARVIVAKGRGFDEGICRALSSIAPWWHTGEWSATAKEKLASQQLRAYISRALGGGYLHEWLRKNGMPHSFKATKAARLAWIDWMINSLEGKH